MNWTNDLKYLWDTVLPHCETCEYEGADECEYQYKPNCEEAWAAFKRVAKVNQRKRDNRTHAQWTVNATEKKTKLISGKYYDLYMDDGTFRIGVFFRHRGRRGFTGEDGKIIPLKTIVMYREILLDGE